MRRACAIGSARSRPATRPAVPEWRASRLICPANNSKPSVDVEQAVGVPVDVVDALDVGTALGAEAATLLRGGDEPAETVGERLLRRGDDRHADAERLF